jgi:hypothetical protein
MEPRDARFCARQCRMVAAEQTCAPHPTPHWMLFEIGATLVAGIVESLSSAHSCNLAEQSTLYKRAMFCMRAPMAFR